MNGRRPIAIITGATVPGRVGLASACELARAGCDVVITHRAGAAQPLQTQLDAAREAIRLAGGTARVEAVDLADSREAEHWALELAAALPRADVLVHNASMYAPTASETLSVDEAHRFFAVNALAPLLVTRALAGRLAASPLPGGASVITMCDIHAMGELGQARRGHAAYSMSKAALYELTLVLARELAPRIRVNGVAPGVVAFAAHENPAFQAQYLARVPLGRSGSPEEAARVVRWLALEATYCTGQVVRVDGGRAIT